MGLLRLYELKLADGRVVLWNGESGESSARSYAESHVGTTVLAYRDANRHGMFVMGRRIRITEPGQRGW